MRGACVLFLAMLGAVAASELHGTGSKADCWALGGTDYAEETNRCFCRADFTEHMDDNGGWTNFRVVTPDNRCVRCPAHSRTWHAAQLSTIVRDYLDDQGMQWKNECFCAPGWYMHESGACLQCTAGVSCYWNERQACPGRNQCGTNTGVGHECACCPGHELVDGACTRCTEGFVQTGVSNTTQCWVPPSTGFLDPTPMHLVEPEGESTGDGMYTVLLLNQDTLADKID